MQVEKTREILRLFERAAADHMAWLMCVHSALMFPGAAPPPSCSPEGPWPLLCLATCGNAEELEPLGHLRAAMYGEAQELLGHSARDGRVDPQSYQRFMAAVDAYAKEARRTENLFRRLLVETDPLTGIHNRQGMMRELRREWTRASRTGQPICLALADLDHFKAVNDTWGHAAGDRVLCATAAFFQRRLRPYDMVYRYGGEEFLFCLPNTDVVRAARVLDRLRRDLARLPVQLDCGERIAVTCSLGVAQMVPGRSISEAMAAADQALYAAKDGGRNRIVVAPAVDEVPAAAAIAARLQRTPGVAQR